MLRECALIVAISGSLRGSREASARSASLAAPTASRPEVKMLNLKAEFGAVSVAFGFGNAGDAAFGSGAGLASGFVVLALLGSIGGGGTQYALGDV